MTTRICVAVSALVAAVFAGASGGAASMQSRQAATPTFSDHWIQATPGKPLVTTLDPGKAAVCFVGLHGPKGQRAVGWRFQPAGHRLTLTLLTESGAKAGQWELRASCQRYGGKAHQATVLVAVPPPGGTGVLAAHGDMRVQVLAAT
jgi:hypothetical protein